MDGKEVEITPVGGAMLAFKLSKGPHVIELRYTPEGFKAGLVISILAVLIFIAMVIFRWKKINLLSTVSEKFRASGAYDKAYGDNTSPDNIAGSQEDADDPADPTYTMEDGPQESLPDLSESDDNES